MLTLRNMEDMDRIIGQFLDFARLDGGESIQAVNLPSLVSDTVERYRRMGHAIMLATDTT